MKDDAVDEGFEEVDEVRDVESVADLLVPDVVEVVEDL